MIDICEERTAVPNWMTFEKQGGRVIFNPQINIAHFLELAKSPFQQYN